MSTDSSRGTSPLCNNLPLVPCTSVRCFASRPDQLAPEETTSDSAKGLQEGTFARSWKWLPWKTSVCGAVHPGIFCRLLTGREERSRNLVEGCQEVTQTILGRFFPRRHQRPDFSSWLLRSAFPEPWSWQWYQWQKRTRQPSAAEHSHPYTIWHQIRCKQGRTHHFAIFWPRMFGKTWIVDVVLASVFFSCSYLGTVSVVNRSPACFHSRAAKDFNWFILSSQFPRVSSISTSCFPFRLLCRPQVSCVATRLAGLAYRTHLLWRDTYETIGISHRMFLAWRLQNGNRRFCLPRRSQFLTVSVVFVGVPSSSPSSFARCIQPSMSDSVELRWSCITWSTRSSPHFSRHDVSCKEWQLLLSRQM